MADVVEDFGGNMRVDRSSKKKKGGRAKKAFWRIILFFMSLFNFLLEGQVQRTQHCQAGDALR